MFEALGRKTRGFAEKNWSEKAQQGIAQLQAGAGNEIGQETPFEEVTRSDFFVSWLFFSWMFGIENLVQVASFGLSRHL